MGKRFYIKDGDEYWKPDPVYREQKLAMLGDGKIVILTDMVKEGWKISDIPKGYKYTEKRPPETLEVKVEKEECKNCYGTGQSKHIVDHDREGNSVWEDCQCWKCNGTGYLVKK